MTDLPKMNPPRDMTEEEEHEYAGFLAARSLGSKRVKERIAKRRKWKEREDWSQVFRCC